MEIDTSKPNISRIYDYVLGGRNNFEVDRIAAEDILKAFPSYPKWARLNRWFLQMIAADWGASGHRYILDIGSGLPNDGHFHLVTPQAKVLYTDSDEFTVTYARDMIGDNPNVRYIHTDVRDPEEFLAEADAFFGGERRVAIGCIGIIYFMNEDLVSQLMQRLHRWAAPGSIMALSFWCGEHDKAVAVQTAARRNNVDSYLRTVEQTLPLLAPWNIRESRSLAKWLGAEQTITVEDRDDANYDMHGVILDY